MSPTFLALEHVLAIHRRSIREFGGDSAVRDQGLLESAIAMPAAQFGGSFLHDGVPAMAAAYLFHLCRNHPFVDGNKRTALASAEVFLFLNGMRLRATNDEVEALTLGVAASRISKDETTALFVKHAAIDAR
ncbi:MAG TPA: type II toxin-antitoxin system death-on-curing family toxin [Planctomycetota bacterium]|nr:type II toxin-antitoxin system death-on-curing family toxin [Planctomycetota bacterium]